MLAAVWPAATTGRESRASVSLSAGGHRGTLRQAGFRAQIRAAGMSGFLPLDRIVPPRMGICSGRRGAARVSGVVHVLDVMRLGLLAVLLVGLLATTPVTCICAPSDHGGMSIHPIFPHTHPSEVGQAGHEHVHEHHHHAADPALSHDDDEPLVSLRPQLERRSSNPNGGKARL